MKFFRVALVIVILALVVGLAYLFLKKGNKSSGHHHTGSTGSSVCANEGSPCSSTKCCGSLQCTNGYCIEQILSPVIPSLFLTTGSTNYGLTAEGHIGPISEPAVWVSGEVPASFWFWDGAGQLALRTPHFNANGAIVAVDSKYILPPTVPNSYVQTQSTPGSGIRLTAQGAIYSSDFGMCVAPDDTNTLMWKNCLGIPYTFDLVTPSQCSTGGCSPTVPCCPPYNHCDGGGCSTCFGDPMKSCPDPTDEAVCGEDGIYTCKSKCSSTMRDCGIAQTGSCVIDGTGYTWECAWKCGSSGSVDCGATNVPSCTGSDASGWSWQCPYNACDHPAPSFNPATSPLSGYTWDTDHYENTSPGASWKYPHWECATQTWTFLDGCNQTYKQTCSDPSMKAACSQDTSFQWQCVPHTQYTDLCGLSTGSCGPDAQCFDISACPGEGQGDGNDWRWICPSSDGTTRCDLIKINNWAYPPLNIPGVPDGIVTNAGGVPLYPTVLNSTCRGVGTDMNHPDARTKINNPAGSLMGSGTAANPYALYTGGADRNHIITVHSIGDGTSVNCISGNPCLNGTFVPSASPLEIDNPGVVTPPDAGELMKNGSCSCDGGFADSTCSTSVDQCGGPTRGTIATCNSGVKCNPEGYDCTCLSVYRGKHCQFDPSQCSGNGTPNDDLDTLQCTCNPGFAGDTCQFNRSSCNNHGTPQSGSTLQCTCDINYGGTTCGSCTVAAPSIMSLTNGAKYSIQAYGMATSNGMSAYLGYSAQEKMWYYSVTCPRDDAGAYGYSPDGSSMFPQPVLSWVFTATANSDGTFNLTTVSNDYSSIPNVTVDGCGFIRSGTAFVCLSENSYSDKMSLSTVSLPGTGSLYLVPQAAPTPAAGQPGMGTRIVFQGGANSLGTNSVFAGPAVAACGNPTCGFFWTVAGMVNHDGSLLPATLESSNGGTVYIGGINGNQLMLDNDNSQTHAQFTWNYYLGGSIMSGGQNVHVEDDGAVFLSSSTATSFTAVDGQLV